MDPIVGAATPGQLSITDLCSPISLDCSQPSPGPSLQRDPSWSRSALQDLADSAVLGLEFLCELYDVELDRPAGAAAAEAVMAAGRLTTALYELGSALGLSLRLPREPLDPGDDSAAPPA